MRIGAIRKSAVSVILFGILCVSVSGAASVTSSGVSSPSDAAASLYVSGYTLSPEVFFPSETGKVTVYVTNPTNLSIGVSQPNFIDPHVKVDNSDTFSTMTTLGPGSTAAFSFVISVDAHEGTFFPTFTVSPSVYGSTPIHTQIPVTIDATDIRVAVVDKPDNFAVDRADSVNISISNPRGGNITDVIIAPAVSGINVTPLESYTGVLQARSSVTVPFEITPVGSHPDLTFHVSYKNGDNLHSAEVVLPLNIGEDKTAAIPVINNIVLDTSGSYFHMTGDVNNAGITDAKSMVLTVGSPARAVEPYAEYSVGTLASDDFSGFDLTFLSSDLSSVPVIVRWKDIRGNSFTSRTDLDLTSLASGGSSGASGTRQGSSGSSSPGGNSSGGPGGPGGGARGPGGGGFFIGGRGSGLTAFYPVIAGGIVLIVAVVLWTRRKWIAAKIGKH